MKNALILTAMLVTAPGAMVHAQPVQAAAAAFSIDTPIEQLMANAKSRAVVEKHLPGIDKHPMYDTFKGLSLVRLQPMSGGLITDAQMTAITKDLSALAAK